MGPDALTRFRMENDRDDVDQGATTAEKRPAFIITWYIYLSANGTKWFLCFIDTKTVRAEADTQHSQIYLSANMIY